MNPYKVGDVVICAVDDDYLTLGKHYTITHVYPYTVRLADTPFDWYWHRFVSTKGEIA